jgi:drug/metabolite transporter (DMT)-like permease
MYPYIFGMSLLKSGVPYFRKHLLSRLTSIELVFLNTFIIFTLVAIIFVYYLIIDKKFTINNLIQKYKNLEITQIIALLVIGILTVSSSIIINEFDKNFNTPLINNLFIRGTSLIFVILVGVFLFEEKYNWKQILGVGFTIVGLFLLFQNEL